MKGLSAGVGGFGLAVLVLCKPALAAGTLADAPPPELIAKERPTTRSFYGWKILLVGGVGGLAAGASLALPDRLLGTLPSTVGFLAGMPAYVLGGPATHWSHGDFTKGMVSLGGNVVLPVIAGVLGSAIGCAPSDAADNCGTRGFLTGFATALVTVPIVDAFVLGWENVVVEESFSAGAGPPARIRAAQASRFTWAPAWGWGKEGAWQLGISGRF